MKSDSTKSEQTQKPSLENAPQPVFSAQHGDGLIQPPPHREGPASFMVFSKKQQQGCIARPHRIKVRALLTPTEAKHTVKCEASACRRHS